MNFWAEERLWRQRARLYCLFRSRFPFNRILERENQNLQRLLQSVVVAGAGIAVDVGTGNGNVLRWLNRFALVIGIDSNFIMLQQAKQHVPTACLMQGEAGRLPLKPAVADLVVAVGLTEYLRDAAGIFYEAQRILSSTGCLIITSAPPGLWTCLRRLLGHGLFPRTAAQIAALGRQNNFRLQAQMRTMMQEQLLFQKV